VDLDAEPRFRLPTAENCPFASQRSSCYQKSSFYIRPLNNSDEQLGSGISGVKMATGSGMAAELARAEVALQIPLSRLPNN
jgi:hypothetical protein